MKKIISVLILFVVFTSCKTLVHYDYEKSTDFSKYKTYNYFDDMKTGLSELDTKRLIRAMDTKLETMGLLKSEYPDFYIDIQSQDVQSLNNRNVGIGVGGGGGHIGGGVAIGIPVGVNKQTREIVIEFVDDSNTGMFWQAISENTYRTNATPEKREQQFIAVVDKVFSAYPPEK